MRPAGVTVRVRVRVRVRTRVRVRVRVRVRARALGLGLGLRIGLGFGLGFGLGVRRDQRGAPCRREKAHDARGRYSPLAQAQSEDPIAHRLLHAAHLVRVG